MEEIVEVKGRLVTLWVESGIVAALRRDREMEVSGTIYEGSGEIRTRVHKQTLFSVLGDDGVERPHRFTGHDQVLRNGQRVSLIHATYANQKGTWAYIVVHNAKQVLCPWINQQHKYIYRLDLVKKIGCLWFLAAAVVLVAVSGIFPDLPDETGGALVLSLLGVLLLLKFIQWWRAHSVWKELDLHFGRIIGGLLEGC